MFRFRQGDAVAIREDRLELGLKAGDTGTIWALYTLETLTYEVTFRTKEDDEFDLTLEECELTSENSSGIGAYSGHRDIESVQCESHSEAVYLPKEAVIHPSDSRKTALSLSS